MSRHGFSKTFQSSFEREGTMDLFIETLTGTAFELTVSPFDTVMSIKLKIQRVEGIPVSQQHLIYNMQELDDSSCLIDYSIPHGATLKLVLSMRGGPISTRRLPLIDDLAWRELRDLVEGSREEMLDLPAGCHVTVLVFQEGDQVNLFRVVENEDGTYSPLSDSMTGTSLRNLFAEEDSEDFQRRLQENSVTMSKVNELRSKMEKLSLQRKPKKSGASVLPTKHGVNQSRHCTPGSHSLHKSPEPKNGNLKIRTHQSHFHLPPISNRSENIVPSSPTTKPSVPRNSYLEVSSLLDGAASRRREEQDVKLPKPGKSSLNFSPSYGMQEKEFDFQNLPSHGLLAPFASSSNEIEHRRVNRNLSNLRVLPDVKPKIESNYGCSRESAKKVIERTNSNRELDLPDSHKLNVVAQPDMTILEEHAPAVLTEVPDISSTPRPISVQSHKETAVLMSELPSDAVASSVKNLAENHYRLIILDEENRPKTSPENLTEHQKAAQKICSILNETKWHRRRRLNLVSTSSSNINLIDGNTNEVRQVQKVDDVVSKTELPPCKPKFLEVDSKSVTLDRRKSLNLHPTFALEHLNSNQGLHNEASSVFQNKLVSNTSTPSSIRNNVPSTTREEIFHVSHNLPSHATLPLEKIGARKKTIRPRCSVCRKRLNITNVYTCRCEKLFCSAHRYSELHECTYDYKREGRKLLQQANPLVAASKLPKI